MKQFRIIVLWIVMILSGNPLYSRQWRVEDLSNPHLADSTRFVANPDGVLSVPTMERLDETLRTLQRQSSVEMTVVAIDSIDSRSDIDTYATELFNRWGIGKKDTDNGVLLLLSKGTREVTIRTGRGTEGVVPDITAGRIIRHQMLPRFRENDYDGGVESGVAELVGLLGDPEGAASLRSSRPNNRGASEQESGADIFFTLYLRLAMISGVVMLILVGLRIVTTRKLGDADRYKRLDDLSTIALFMVFAGLLFPLPAWLWLRWKLRRVRNHPRKCPNCSTALVRLNEEADNDYLTSGQDAEERVNSIDYDVWLCPECQSKEVIPYVNRSSSYKPCPRCQTRTYHLSGTSTLKAPTPTSEGEGVKRYTCTHCGYLHQERYAIPRIVVIPPTRRRGGGNGFGGGGFGGGSFGGGRSFGGGATGRW